MNFSPRSQKIVSILLDSSDPVKEQALADTLGLSKRTIQRELEAVDYGLRSYHLSLVRKKRIGVQIQGSSEDKQTLQNELKADQEIDFTNIEERRRYLLLELLRDRTPQKLITFADRLGVSEATIASDLESLQDWVNQNHLEIIRRPGYGIVLEGKEIDYREAVNRFINENSDGFYSLDRFQRRELFEKSFSSPSKAGILSLLNQDTILKVMDTLDTMDEPYFKQMTDNAYVALVIHIAISIDRIHKGGIAEPKKGLNTDEKDLASLQLAKNIHKAMEKAFQIKIPQVEISYLQVHIQGSKKDYSTTMMVDEYLDQVDDQQIQMVHRMIERFDPKYQYDLEQDDIFVRGLLIHLQPVLIRLQNHLNIFNPLLKDIKDQYPEVFAKCKDAAKVITEETGYSIQDEEIGYLAMHFGAALERLQEKKTYTRIVRIGVVCASGFGLARLMQTNLRMILPDTVELVPLGTNDMDQASDIDFFVSTFEFKHPHMDSVHVNPLLSEEDIHHIRKKIEEYSHEYKETSIQKGMGQDMDQIASTAIAIKEILANYRQFVVPADIRFDQLVEQLSNEMMGDPKTIAAKIIKREKLSSQVIPELEICLLHCRTQSVSKPIFWVCQSQTGQFQHTSLSPSKAVVWMIAPENEYIQVHLDVLGAISSALVSWKSFLHTIQTGTQADILMELERILQNYFYQVIDQKRRTL